MSMPEVAILRLPNGAGLPLPHYASTDAAGLDLPAAVAASMELTPGARALIPTGFAIALPAGYEAQVRPRSGLALKQGLTVLNTPGTVDADYRGEISVLLINHGQESVHINRGDRIAQMVVAPVSQARLLEVSGLPDSERGDGGYGSTGVSS